LRRRRLLGRVGAVLVLLFVVHIVIVPGAALHGERERRREQRGTTLHVHAGEDT
jgi:hypothetical protein